jgi:hypothetical protein
VNDLAGELRTLEERLLDPQFRRDRPAVASLLAPDFVEFGSSGRIYTRDQILDHLEIESPHRIELTDFAAQVLAPDVILVTWRSIRPDGPPHPRASALRSSIWTRRDGCWQLVFHQGTCIPANTA